MTLCSPQQTGTRSSRTSRQWAQLFQLQMTAKTHGETQQHKVEKIIAQPEHDMAVHFASCAIMCTLPGGLSERSSAYLGTSNLPPCRTLPTLSLLILHNLPPSCAAILRCLPAAASTGSPAACLRRCCITCCWRATGRQRQQHLVCGTAAAGPSCRPHPYRCP